VEWDPGKARLNARKHGVALADAVAVLEDETARTERSCMKKAKTLAADEVRPEYRRSEFGKLVRGKYAARLQASSNVVILDPAVAELFPNAAAVNAALRSLGEIAKRVNSPRRCSR
jgi:uncharacterized DUF497 family protein